MRIQSRLLNLLSIWSAVIKTYGAKID